MIVTIDGPAGAGKSTIARRLAKRLGFQYLDTGAMYRAVAWAVVQSAVDSSDHDHIGSLVGQLDLEFDRDRTILNGRDITGQLRSPDVSQHASIVAEIPRVREILVQLQRDLAGDGDIVCEGRDQGTVVFPDAECKFFLTAAPEIRARRRWQELQAAGESLDVEDVIAEQKIRDLRDETRAVGRLVKADDAVEIRVDHLSIDEILDQLEQHVRTRENASQKY